MQNCNEVCLADVRATFENRLVVSGLSSADQVVAARTLSDLIGPIIADCSTCPRNGQREMADDGSERQRLVEQLAADPKVVHALYGKFGNDKLRVVGYHQGDTDVWNPASSSDVTGVPNVYKYQKYIWGTRDAVVNEAGQALPFFEAVVIRSVVQTPDSSSLVSFGLSYFDPKSPDGIRPGVRTQYTVFVPGDSAYVSSIDADPGIMVDLLHQVFPEADRSVGSDVHGKLHVTPNPIRTR